MNICWYRGLLQVNIVDVIKFLKLFQIYKKIDFNIYGLWIINMYTNYLANIFLLLFITHLLIEIFLKKNITYSLLYLFHDSRNRLVWFLCIFNLHRKPIYNCFCVTRLPILNWQGRHVVFFWFIFFNCNIFYLKQFLFAATT